MPSREPLRRARRLPRLTRRGRALLVTVVAVLLLGAFSLGRVSSTAATESSVGASHLRHVVVAPGESLWAIARQADPGADPRVTVDRIVTLNGLTSATVRPGQRLVLPAG